eukprot:PhM_4_TR3028/c0_g1_i1/m.41403
MASTVTLPLVSFVAATNARTEIQLMPRLLAEGESELPQQITNYNLCVLFGLKKLHFVEGKSSAIRLAPDQLSDIHNGYAGETFVVSGDVAVASGEPARRAADARTRLTKRISDEQRQVSDALKSGAVKLQTEAVEKAPTPPPPSLVASKPAPRAPTPPPVDAAPPSSAPSPPKTDISETQPCPRCAQEVPVASMNLHVVHCARLREACPHCGEYMDKNSIEEHVAKTHATERCPLCQVDINVQQLEQHKTSQCMMREVMCKYCDLHVIVMEAADHEDKCGSRTEPCDRCGSRVMRRDIPSHRCGVVASKAANVPPTCQACRFCRAQIPSDRHQAARIFLWL